MGTVSEGSKLLMAPVHIREVGGSSPSSPTKNYTDGTGDRMVEEFSLAMRSSAFMGPSLLWEGERSGETSDRMVIWG